MELDYDDLNSSTICHVASHLQLTLHAAIWTFYAIHLKTNCTVIFAGYI